ncbi:MAG: hypothetical protein ACYCTI_00045 [Acidimicrobiales bacterium]
MVKLFGDAFDGGASHAAEQAMHQLLAQHPEIPVPGLVGARRALSGRRGVDLALTGDRTPAG